MRKHLGWKEDIFVLGQDEGSRCDNVSDTFLVCVCVLGGGGGDISRKKKKKEFPYISCKSSSDSLRSSQPMEARSGGSGAGLFTWSSASLSASTLVLFFLPFGTLALGIFSVLLVLFSSCSAVPSIRPRFLWFVKKNFMHIRPFFPVAITWAAPWCACPGSRRRVVAKTCAHPPPIYWCPRLQGRS